MKILCNKIFHDFPEEGGEGEEEAFEAEQTEEDIGMGGYTAKLNYEVIGTVKRPKLYKPTEDITLILDEENEEMFMTEIMKCGFVIYDITADDGEIPKATAVLQAIEKKLEEIKEKGPKKFAKSTEQRVFVLISTTMTWAKTRPVDPEDPDVPFVETDFRKRKPHPNYKQHSDLEKEVIAQGKKMKEQFMTVVIASGSTYGEEEEDLHFLFRLAWEHKMNLPLMSPGNNTVPLINIKDLVSVLHRTLERVPKKPKYIVAVEQTQCTQKQIVKTLAKALGNTFIKQISKEEGFLYPYISQASHERLNVNLKMEPNYIVNVLDIPWQSDQNFCENIFKMIKEYKESRNLYAINIIIHGPPAVGKTLLSKKVAEFYDVHYISIPTLIEEAKALMRTSIENAKFQIARKQAKEEAADEEAPEEDEDEEDWDEKIEEYTTKLKEIERGLEENENGRLPDSVLIPMMREKLQSNECQNSGYVLDGFPKTTEQTKELFEISDDAEEEAEEEEEGGNEEEPKKIIFPRYVISLEATDEFLCNRVMQMPEIDIQDTHYTEEHMVRRLNEFRSNNTDENSLLNVFDEREIHPYLINAETDDINSIFMLVQAKIGAKFGYPPSLWEQEQRKLMEEEAYRRELEAARQAKEELEKLQKEENDRNMQNWADLLQQLQHEEQQLLTAQSKSLREYLVRFVFPTLTRGLVETARVKPSDPVDYLAEYLFKENPEGRMFDPACVAAADDMFKVIEAFQQRLGN